MSAPVPVPATTTSSPAPVSVPAPAPTAPPVVSSAGSHAAPAVSKGGAKKSRGKKSRKMNAAAKSWVNFVVEVFKKNRAKNPSYKYKQAMKDAAKLKKKNKTMKL
jgi:hypothetical protein